MSASSELAAQYSESYYIENQYEYLMSNQEYMTEKDILIEGLKNKQKVLSYSSLKCLDSPINFINYYLRPKKTNEGMITGSVIDTLITTPDLFTKNYAVLEDTPSTELQVNFCHAVVEKIKSKRIDKTSPIFEILFNETFKEFYKKGSSENLKHLIPYIYSICENKQVISFVHYQKCKDVSDNLLSQDEILEELEQVEEFQKAIEFEYKGWKIKGKLDAFQSKIFYDFKYASDCTPEKFEYDMRKYQYDLQFGVYSLGLMILGLSHNPKFKFIVYDDKFNYSIIEVDDGYLEYARRKVDFKINCLNKMIAENAFNKSYNFFRSKTKFYKPKWIDRFDNEIFIHR